MIGPLCSLSTHRQLSASSHPTEYRNVHYVQYTDDTQCLNYTSLSALTRHSALSTTVSSPSIAGWTPINGLCLNPDKTEAIVTGTTARQRSEPQVDDVTFAGVTVPVTTTVKETTRDHVNNVCKAAHFHIRALALLHIRRCVSVDDAKTVDLEIDRVDRFSAESSRSTESTEVESIDRVDRANVKSSQSITSTRSRLLAVVFVTKRETNRR